MKVNTVRAYCVRAPVTYPFRSARGLLRERADLLVELVADNGHSGWGNGGDLDTGTEALAAAAPLILGADLMQTDPVHLWDRLSGALPIGELSAVDTALWDLRGQALGQSVAGLLATGGGSARRQVRAYATGLFRQQRWSDADHARELVREAESYAAAGFTAMKLKTGFGLDADVRHTAAIRRTIGSDVALYVDSNAAYTAQQSVSLGEAVAGYEIGWMEEPAGARDWTGYHQVRTRLGTLSPPITVAGGEQLGLAADFAAGCDAAAWDVVQPDVVSAGGITGMWRLGELVRAKGMALVPHCFHTGIALAATLQLLSAQPLNPPGSGPALAHEPLLEYDQTEHPTREALVRPIISQRDGHVQVPDGPGLGITVQRDVLERYATSAETVASL
ncbi:MAG: hypothetical protein CL878_05860 [Dehalococcoidia bacterium]|nr:hypothetical protein [Dehalococcoidia bacterium]